MSHKYYLFSIDLEDIRFSIPGGERYKRVLPELTQTYLSFFDKHAIKTTFFVVGNVARAFPDTIRLIADKGHEIACHSNAHIPLNKHSKQSLKNDLGENLNALYKCGIKKVYGFRAPTFSLTAQSEWVYDILADFGFTYSSSVLPAKNPLYGWSGFGNNMRLMNGKIHEIPMTTAKILFLNVPFAGGVYFRVFPFFLTKRYFNKNWQNHQPVLSYFHPYDIDYKQEKFMHPGINNSTFYNYLMYANRKNLLKKIEKVINLGAEIIPYHNFVQKSD